MKTKCQIYKDEDATVEVTYGLYSEYKKGRPHYVVFLSQKGASELWDKVSALVNLGLAHWSNKPINSCLHSVDEPHFNIDYQ